MIKKIIKPVLVSLIFALQSSCSYLTARHIASVEDVQNQCSHETLDKVDSQLSSISLISNTENEFVFLITSQFFKTYDVSVDDLRFSLTKFGFNSSQDYSSGDISFEIMNKSSKNFVSSNNKIYLVLNKKEILNKIKQYNTENSQSNLAFTGGYQLTLFKNGLFFDEQLWRLTFYNYQNPEISPLLTNTYIDQLAKKYSPILSFTESEEFNPTSLDYIFKNPQSNLKNETFHITSLQQKDPVLSYDQLNQILPFYSNTDAVLKIGNHSLNYTLSNGAKETHLNELYGKDNNLRTVYYSYQYLNGKESGFGKKLLVIHYHFLYPFDYKNSKTSKDPVWAAHAFDRESLSVVLNVSNESAPLLDSVIYGAHLSTQKMGLINPNQKTFLSSLIESDLSNQLSSNDSKQDSSMFLQSWQNGRLMVLNPELKTFLTLNNHPIAMLAQGSHGVYPVPGDYAVVMLNSRALIETAGGSQIITPEMSDVTTAQSQTYKLLPLIENELSACSQNSILNFSGSFVDVQGGLNAQFPPFTEREINVQKYLEVLRQSNEGQGAFKTEILKNSEIQDKLNKIKAQIQTLP